MKGWKDLAKQVEMLGRLKAEVGWQDTAKYPDGTPVALVAQTHEYGSPARRIPPRPMVRPTILAEKNTWSGAMGQGVKAVMQGTRTPLQVMQAIGELAAGDVRLAITQINGPTLATSTKMARKRRGLETEKPLQATGLMLASCTSIVKEK